MSWQLGIAVNGLIAIAYAAISWAVLAGQVRNGQLRTHLLGTATGLIFASCSVGHAGHLLHLLGVPGVSAAVEIEAARLSYDVHILLVDAVTAVVAVVFWSLRASASPDEDSALFGDTDGARRTALQLNEEVVQGLALAGYQLEGGDVDAAAVTVRATLEHARTIISAPFAHDDLLPAGELLARPPSGSSA